MFSFQYVISILALAQMALQYHTILGSILVLYFI